MKRHYTLFIATAELFKCPEIAVYAKQHNVLLHPAEERTLHIVTPLERPVGSLGDAFVQYDPQMISIINLHLMVEGSLLYITLQLTAKDVGETSLTLEIPEATATSLPLAAQELQLTN